MATVNVYLTFNGDCKDAFDFYKSIFGGEYSSISTFGEMPPQEGFPPLTDEYKKRIMHVSLPISQGTVLMGSDSGGDWAPALKVGNNFSISVQTKDLEEGKRIFNALATGGEIKMPFDKTFWQAYFGMITDKFGINWMVNCDIQK